MQIDTQTKRFLLRNKKFKFVIGGSYDNLMLELLELLEDAETLDSVKYYIEFLYLAKFEIGYCNFEKCPSSGFGDGFKDSFEDSEAGYAIKKGFKPSEPLLELEEHLHKWQQVWNWWKKQVL